ncbi:PQQ-binding-like beta-propeller repeat protein [Planctellipticum variicoloris]|uniref:outer membrane protein assembly factor BamB family protein n=1 Tax=Planctellipticum variicoloris TaxID=3064265 RepID=UPI0030131FFE|nr:PQQ-binding-like beta-propeller repeat protein [Planctomycetaceae bacterium SH412]
MVRWSLSVCLLLVVSGTVAGQEKFDPVANALKVISGMKVGAKDWPQWGGSYHRNNTPEGENIPSEWNLETGENVLWAVPLGSQTYGNPVVANGKVYVGTNNSYGYLKRYPSKVDLGCLLCFDEKTGKFLWQASSPKLPTGRVHDWPQQGICSTVYCEGDKVWYVTSRGEVMCLDVEGFHDGENDGPFKAEPNENKDEADVIWRLDMMGVLGVSQHNMCSCSLTCVGDLCFVNTSNGVDESHIQLPAPNAPSFLCLDKNTGKVLWQDNSPGLNILHGQWSSPLYFETKGQAQVVFGAGDGWIYSFDPKGDGNGNPYLLWKFDANPKDSLYLLGGRATRNHIIGTPIFYDGHVYAAVGEDPEHGEGVGHLYCIDPNRRGDVGPELAFDKDGKELAPRRLQDIDVKKGETAKPNPNSAVVWHYSAIDTNKNGKMDFEETMHRTIGSAAIKDDLLFIVDFSGLVHCLDAKKVVDGKPVVYWTHDMFAASWGSPLIVDGKVYCGDEDGDITIFELSKDLNIIAEINMVNSIYSTPVVANDTLFISNKSTLFAIKQGAKLEGGVKEDRRAAGGDSE